jgi:hypothetical protein
MSIPDILEEIRTDRLPNTDLERCHYTGIFGDAV